MAAGSMFRVGVLGYGAIGSVVADQWAAGSVQGAQLEGVILRRQHPGLEHEQLGIQQALERCDLVVECAGQHAVREHAVRILQAGVDLLASSMGALADWDLAASVQAAGPGRLISTAGAIGGLDLLGAAARMGGIEQVLVTTRKLPATLVQPWMDARQRSELEQASGPVEVFNGPAAVAAKDFEKSLNVAAAVALAVGDWDAVQVRLLADPAAELTEHLIEVHGPAGEYSFLVKNYPSARNPRTSGIVPWALLHSIQQAADARR
ncbi:aspartate dehydrogenase domain-containing protein [Glutamicibacter nicotianae]|uniref:aspartate dehydrogenase domain-containing protein n=1 Tax=Glutamicibacter nicotianae TaxID=37929 RepID=UPI0019560699|nr:aspartate dehydrogenase domain-containing protein [Glutamicibacter nicotianae]MBM7767238.1 aspartate dehydrogenase [Glutamicibacter nicotianae]